MVIPPKAVQFYKINGNGKEWWMLFKVRIFTQDGALTQQLLYTNGNYRMKWGNQVSRPLGGPLASQSVVLNFLKLWSY